MSEPKGHYQMLDSSVVLDLTFASRTRSDTEANVKLHHTRSVDCRVRLLDPDAVQEKSRGLEWQTWPFKATSTRQSNSRGTLIAPGRSVPSGSETPPSTGSPAPAR